MSLGSGLGIAQLIAWGTIYYAIAVLGDPMQRDLKLSRSEVYGLFNWSLALSGLLAPSAGRLVDRLGGRAVLVAGALLGALGFAVVASARSVWVLGVGWTIEGIAMAFGLYDTCFAALGQAAPDAYRRAVTAVTLIAGLASTCFWPISHYLVEELGWRATYGVFAVLLMLCVPLYLLVLPPLEQQPLALAEPSIVTPPADTPAVNGSARMLTLAFAGAALVSGALSAHLVGALGGLGFSPTHAVWVASSIGVMQVLGRIVELRFGGGMSAARLGALTFAVMTVSLTLLLVAALVPAAVMPFAVLYGAANGVMTIVKAVLPVEMFGTRGVGAVLGHFAAPSLVARAAAPWAYALAEEIFGGSAVPLALLVAVSGCMLCVYLYALRRGLDAAVFVSPSDLPPHLAQRLVATPRLPVEKESDQQRKADE